MRCGNWLMKELWCPENLPDKTDVKSTHVQLQDVYCPLCFFNLLQAHRKFYLQRRVPLTCCISLCIRFHSDISAVTPTSTSPYWKSAQHANSCGYLQQQGLGHTNFTADEWNRYITVCRSKTLQRTLNVYRDWPDGGHLSKPNWKPSSSHISALITSFC